MTYWDRKLAREQLDGKLEKLKPLLSFNTDSGWIKVIREVLGMSTKQLGKRVGITNLSGYICFPMAMVAMPA